MKVASAGQYFSITRGGALMTSADMILALGNFSSHLSKSDASWKWTYRWGSVAFWPQPNNSIGNNQFMHT